MLDDMNLIKNRDSGNALGVAADECNHARFKPVVEGGAKSVVNIENIVLTGMGGSALAALLVKSWLKDEIKVPFEVLRSYDLPAYVNESTLVIASSYSGNTEETLSALGQAEESGAQLAVIASGGDLLEIGTGHNVTHVKLPAELQPRMAVTYNLRALIALFASKEIVAEARLGEIEATADWLESEISGWIANVPEAENYAKQLAMKAVGKTPVFYAGSLMAPVAYKWKISWNENAKNVSFWNEIPEFNHNEFMGWTSHPVEKPFAVFDLVSNYEHPQILKRFELSDKLLSGKRPKSNTVNLKGETPISQMLWGSILADFVSIYVAILNNVDPTPVDLIEKFKKELS